MGCGRQEPRSYEEALALHRRSLGAKHHRTVSNMNLLASDYLMLSDPLSAQALLEEALPIGRELYPNDIQTARTLEGLANVLMRQDKPDGAMPLAEEALVIALKVAGEDSLDAALAFSTVAEVHRSGGRPERALPLYRKARALYEKSLGPDHPRVRIDPEPGRADPDGRRQTGARGQLMARVAARAHIPARPAWWSRRSRRTIWACCRLKQKRYAEVTSC